MRLPKDIAGGLWGLMLAGTVFAAPADDIKALVEKGNPRAAYELGKKHPEQLGNPAFDFFFGIAAIDSGHAGEGVLALERYIIHFPGNLQAKLELGRGYFLMGDYLRAREEFNDVLRTKPPAAVVANIERYLDAIRAREAAFRTTAGAFIEFGVGRDSNINRDREKPHGSPLPHHRTNGSRIRRFGRLSQYACLHCAEAAQWPHTHQPGRHFLPRRDRFHPSPRAYALGTRRMP